MALGTFIRQVFAGKTLGRIVFNDIATRRVRALSGRVLDLASGRETAYHRALRSEVTLVRTDAVSAVGIRHVDIDAPLPFSDASFDHALLFNALYIVREPERLLAEMRRILKPGGSALIASPFLMNEAPEPHDYRRLTREGLAETFRNAGFQTFAIEPYGERWSAAANLLHGALYFSAVRLFIYSAALALDALIPRRVREGYPAPLGYFCTLTKHV